MRVIDKDSIKFIHERSLDNLILIDKPVQWSSFDVVKNIRNVTRIKKVGHGGTLDPFATGLLILGTGKETKVLAQIGDATKEYFATIEFGKITDTYDVTGIIRKQVDVSDINNINFKPILDSFLGELQQIPPMFSAKKVGGKRLYKMARKGIEIKRKAQTIFIYEIKQLRQDNASLDVYVKCSKGTYIRSLAFDIGQKSGYGAYLKNLRRVAIDNFNVEKALTVNDFHNYWSSIN
jgi:tRNA pseudouridine55 synthase